jgi:uncharacterized membrane protein YagU involved in acid resistance
MQTATLTNAKAQRMRQWKAVVVGFIAAIVAGVLAAVAVAMWDKPRVWVPVLAGFAVGVISYALIAPPPES